MYRFSFAITAICTSSLLLTFHRFPFDFDRSQWRREKRPGERCRRGSFWTSDTETIVQGVARATSDGNLFFYCFASEKHFASL